MEIIADTAMEAWKRTLRYLKEKCELHEDENDRKCMESLNMTVVVNDPTKEITKPITILNSFDKWIYPSLEEIEDSVIDKVKNSENNTYYGSRLFNFGEKRKNQIDDFIIPLLKKKVGSRRAVCIVWNPNIDAMADIKNVTGVISYIFRVKDDKLNITVVLRSSDFFFGWPTNVYQSFCLQKYVAENLGLKIGSITSFSVNAHIFEDQMEYIKKVIY